MLARLHTQSEQEQFTCSSTIIGEPSWPLGSGSVRIACFGDSVAVLLSEPLRAEDRAVWGAPVAALAEQVNGATPDVAVLSGGVNDVLMGMTPIDWRPLLDAAETLRGGGAQVFVLPVQFAPWRPLSPPEDAAVLSANAATGALPLRLPVWGWQPDGVHPNRLGQRWLAGRLRALFA